MQESCTNHKFGTLCTHPLLVPTLCVWMMWNYCPLFLTLPYNPNSCACMPVHVHVCTVTSHSALLPPNSFLITLRLCTLTWRVRSWWAESTFGCSSKIQSGFLGNRRSSSLRFWRGLTRWPNPPTQT